MVDFKSRRHRLELPAMPNSDDPAVLKRAMDQMKRLVQDEFNRLSTDFYDFKKATYDAAIIPLRGVSNIAVTKSEYGMAATWENPDGQEVTPTHVRVRILEVSPNSWATYTYPISSWEFSGLTPGTQYTFQVQLIATFEATDTFVSTTRNCPSVPVLRTAESDIKAKVFTTDTGVGPPTNAGTNDDNVIFVFPNTDGTPGPAGGTDCYWGYKFQYRTACAWADTAVSEVEVAGNVGNVTIDTGNAPFSTYPNTLFRLAYREICNAVPQPWVYGEGFMAVDFSNADCLGIAKSDSISVDYLNTADIFIIPGVCQADGTFIQIVDVLTDTELQPQLPGLKCIEYIDNEWTLIGNDTDNPAINNTIFTPMLSGEIAAITNIQGDASDFTLGFDIWVEDNSLVVAGGTGAYTYIDIGDTIKVNVQQKTSAYDIIIVVPRDGGGSYNFRAEDLAYGEWNSVFYQHDVSEPDGRKLYVNYVLMDQSTNAIANNFDGLTTSLKINTVNAMKLRKFGMWASLVTPALDPPSLIGNCIHWWDFSTFTPTSGTTIVDLVGTADATIYNSGTFGTLTATGDDGKSYPLLADISAGGTPNEYLETAYFADMALHTATGDTLSFFVIFWPDDPSGDAGTTNHQRVLFQRGSGGTNDYRQEYVSQNVISGGGSFSVVNYNAGGSTRGAWAKWGIPAPRNQTWHAYFSEIFNNGGSGTSNVDNDAWEQDGTLMTPDSEAIFNSAGQQADTTEGLRIGGSRAANDEWFGAIAHLIIWDGVLTDPERAAVIEYFTVEGWF